jgi:hypothetical protein
LLFVGGNCGLEEKTAAQRCTRKLLVKIIIIIINPPAPERAVPCRNPRKGIEERKIK